MVKIIFFDIDGTMISTKTKKMTETMKDTLLKLHDKGIKLVVATGRPLMNVPKFIDVSFDCVMCFNGSYCVSGNDVIFNHPIPHDDVIKVVNNALKLGLHSSVATKDDMGANGKDKNLVEYYAIAEKEVEIAYDFDELLNNDIYQIMIGATKDEYDALLDGADGASITSWWPKAVDVIPANCGKGQAVKKILDYYGINKEEAMAFGDGENDIEMFKAVGEGVSMGNANEIVKNNAHATCLSVEDDGIYYYLKDKGII